MARSDEPRARVSVPAIAGVGAATVVGNYAVNLLATRAHPYAYFAAEAVVGAVVGTQTRHSSVGAGLVAGALTSAVIRYLTGSRSPAGASTPEMSPTARILGLNGPFAAPLPPPAQTTVPRTTTPTTPRTTVPRTTTPRMTAPRPTTSGTSAPRQTAPAPMTERDRIAAAQRILARLFPTYRIARLGTMDTDTMRYLTTFQRTRGLSPTGLLDTATWRALQAAPVPWPALEAPLPNV